MKIRVNKTSVLSLHIEKSYFRKCIPQACKKHRLRQCNANIWTINTERFLIKRPADIFIIYTIWVYIHIYLYSIWVLRFFGIDISIKTSDIQAFAQQTTYNWLREIWAQFSYISSDWLPGNWHSFVTVFFDNPELTLIWYVTRINFQ